MQEVLGIPREWMLHFPDQMTVASIWKAANNNCPPFFSVVFYFFFQIFPSPSSAYMLSSFLSLLSVSQQNNKTDESRKAAWLFPLELLGAYLCCAFGLHTEVSEWHHLAVDKESHVLHFHPANYQPEQVEADLMNPNEEARPVFAAAAHDPICVLKCQPL